MSTSDLARYSEDVPEFSVLHSISNADADAYDAQCVDVETPCRYDILWERTLQSYRSLDRARARLRRCRMQLF